MQLIPLRTGSLASDGYIVSWNTLPQSGLKPNSMYFSFIPIYWKAKQKILWLKWYLAPSLALCFHDKAGVRSDAQLTLCSVIGTGFPKMNHIRGTYTRVPHGWSHSTSEASISYLTSEYDTDEFCTLYLKYGIQIYYDGPPGKNKCTCMSP